MYAAGFAEAIITLIKWILVILVSAGAGYLVLGALLDRRLSPLETLIGFLAIFGFAGLAIGISETPWFWVLLVAVVILFFSLRSLPARLGKKRDRRFWHRDVARYQQGIDFDPSNPDAYVYLADTYMKLNNYKPAVENYKKALELQPNNIQAQKKLNRALKVQEMAESDEMFCPRCQTARPRGLNECLSCGYHFSSLQTVQHNIRHGAVEWGILFGIVTLAAAALILVLVLMNRFDLAILSALAFLGVAYLPFKRLSQYK